MSFMQGRHKRCPGSMSEPARMSAAYEVASPYQTDSDAMNKHRLTPTSTHRIQASSHCGDHPRDSITAVLAEPARCMSTDMDSRVSSPGGSEIPLRAARRFARGDTG